MTKLVQAFLTGIFFTFILDFFIFLGIKLHYIDYYEIAVYYNILFADHQNIYIFLAISTVLGYIVTYVNNTKLSIITIGTLCIIVSLTLLETIGNKVGEIILMDKNTTLYSKKYTYDGDIYYNGRKKITFYDYKLKKIILLNKKELK